MMLKLMIDEMSYKEKPTGAEIGKIQNRLGQQSALKEVTIEQLCSYIEKGYTFCPAVTIGGMKNEDWRQQQLICIDVDNDNDKIITPEEAVNLLEKVNIHTMGYYHTFSSTSELPKFRLLFLLPAPLTDKNKVKFIVEALIDFIGGDQACKNLSRIFFGTDGQTKKVTVVNANATITLDDVIRIYKPSSPNNYNKNDELMQMVHEFDFLGYISKEYEVDHVSGNTIYFKKCPICGHNDCFRFYSNTNTFFCFGQNGRVGGSIIDYLMLTKNMELKDAIRYFKSELLGINEKPSKKHTDSSASNEEKKIKSQITENIRKLGYPVPSIEDIDWIYNSADDDSDEPKWKLSCPALAKFISDNIPYIFAKNRSKSGIIKYFYCDNRYKMLDDEEILYLIKQFIEPLSLHKMTALKEVLNLLMTEINHHRLMEDMNANENIINFKNGILDIRTGKLLPHSSKYLITTQIPCNYVENCPVPEKRYFDNFLNDFTKGNVEIKRLILQGMGVALSNVRGYRMKQAFFCIGPGNSGKSQVKLLLTRLIGVENCTSVDLKDLERPFHAIELLNKRLAGSNDMSGMKINSLEKFKQITGGDYITDSYKNEGLIDFRYNGVIWMLGNRMPVFGGDKGDHVYDRMVIIECDNVIPEEKRDKQLLEHLLEEKEYIVSLAIGGLMEVINNGYQYDIPEICKQRNQLYRVENDSFLSFYEECLVDRPENEPIKDKCTVKIIYQTYKEWCKANNGGYAQTKKEMKKMLTDMGKGEIIHTNGGYDYFKYITLSLRAKKEYDCNNNDLFIDDPDTANDEETGINNTVDQFDF